MGDPEEFAARYYEAGADEIVYMDIVASLYGRSNLTEIVDRASQHIFVPLTVGGGVKSLEDVNRLLRSGADKVAINGWLLKNPDFVSSAVKTFGSQCIVGSIEAKKSSAQKWVAFYNNGREPSGKDVVEWAKELVERGVGELLVTSIDQEGTKRGFDCELVGMISQKVNVPVIASGGAGSLQDIKAVIYHGKADAVAIASLFHFGILSVGDVKQHLQNIKNGERESPLLSA